MNTTTTDRIEKQIVLKAPRFRVWRAISDWQEFGEWFRVKLDQPFVAGASSTGHLIESNYEHLKWNVTIDKIEPERYFSLRWHPHPIEPDHDYSDEPTTLVEFVLEDVPEGTKLTLTESGFDGIPLARRAQALESNGQGWAIQMERIAKYVADKS